jgi:2-amino-4-hydroxy-6-hydroxymethyldihydropteridine diphosphokinase
MTVPPATEWAWIALGSNLGHRGRALACLRAALEAGGGAIRAASAEILTVPVGVVAQGDFHNQVLLVGSPEPWPPERWLQLCLGAERHCGRRLTYRWGPRRADADLILLGRRGEVVAAGDPRVPHPELAHRAFWRLLIAQIDPPLAAALS